MAPAAQPLPRAHFRAQLQALPTTSLSPLEAFCLWERRVSRICLHNLRSICSDEGYLTQGPVTTSVLGRGVLFGSIPRFLDIPRQLTAHLLRQWIPSSAHGSDGGADD